MLFILGTVLLGAMLIAVIYAVITAERLSRREAEAMDEYMRRYLPKPMSTNIEPPWPNPDKDCSRWPR